MPSDWSQALDLAVWAIISLGTVFSVIGAVGLVRFPDFYTRVHAVGVTDTMGAGLILLACAVQEGLTLNAVKLVTVWGFIYLTGPAATHALAKAAFAKGLRVDGAPADTGRDSSPAADAAAAQEASDATH